MKRQLCIIGAGGYGKVIADAAQKAGYYKDIIFFDDNSRLIECDGFPIIGNCSEVIRFIGVADVIVAIGDARTRQEIQEWLRKVNASIATVIHPKAIIGRHVTIGRGTAVMAGVVINSGSTIGEGCIINTCSSVDHDCRLADYVHIAIGSHLAGNVDVGERTWIGAGATVSNNVFICAECMVGAGAVVIRDIKEPGTYVGVPAGRKYTKSKWDLRGRKY